MDTCRVTIGVQASLDVRFYLAGGRIFASARWKGAEVEGDGATHHEALANLKRRVEADVEELVEDCQVEPARANCP